MNRTNTLPEWPHVVILGAAALATLSIGVFGGSMVFQTVTWSDPVSVILHAGMFLSLTGAVLCAVLAMLLMARKKWEASDL